jgi:hypothetical protein
MTYLALIVVLLLVAIFLWYYSSSPKHIEHELLELARADEEPGLAADGGRRVMEMENVAVDRGMMRYSPQPDTTRCYWGSDYSQSGVDKFNRLNVADIETPLVAARTNLMQGCFCRCGGDMIGKTVYD